MSAMITQTCVHLLDLQLPDGGVGAPLQTLQDGLQLSSLPLWNRCALDRLKRTGTCGEALYDKEEMLNAKETYIDQKADFFGESLGCW